VIPPPQKKRKDLTYATNPKENSYQYRQAEINELIKNTINQDVMN